MEKKAFVTKEMIERFVENIPHRFISMMKRESVRMQKH